MASFASVTELTRNKDVTILCDNSAFVAVFKKKHSKCEYTYTVAKALYDVAAGVGAIVRVEKTKRCSSPYEEAADALSKGDWIRAWDNMPQKNEDPGRIPCALLQWANNPTPDMNLGYKILSDMSSYTKVLFLK